MKSVAKSLIIFCLATYLPVQANAWGQLGHRIVGQIAECHLTKKSKREVKSILGNESVAMASTWADFIKSEPSYNYLNNWHYINLPADLSVDQLTRHLEQDTSTNVYTRILFLSKELKKRELDQDKKRMYLRLLIHLVGDLHQPMHTGRFSDLGGNRVQLTWFGENTNLHRVWDSDLIESQELSYTEYASALNYVEKSQVRALQNESVGQWVISSYQISQNLYSKIKAGDKLSYRYIYDNLSTAEQQLLKGGIHLAGLLNEIFS